ncbi:MAG: NAD(P)/FAD-dependent oxidoreductase [Bacteroidota bacterium]
MSNTTYTTLLIGAGFSGIALGVELRKRGLNDFLILEKAEEIGGTWRDNTYPGAECDIPSALYSFSFAGYADWEYKWSHQPQILSYLRQCAADFGVQDHVRCGQEVTGAHWQAEAGQWIVFCRNGQQYRTRTLVSAIGQLHHPSTPKLPGAETFSGATWHSARWDHSVSLTGKRVGVIGNGASAAQFIPEVAKEAKSVVVFQRTANWILPKQDRAYREWEKRLVRRFPFLLQLYRAKIYLLTSLFYFAMQGGNRFFRSVLERWSKWFIRRKIKDPAVAQKLVPDYPLGARRVLFSDDYYPALAQDHVTLETDGIAQIVPTGIQTQTGTQHELDVLIYGTGFVTHPFLLHIDLRGTVGQSIHEAWREAPRAYKGISIAGFPNFFMLYGPNTNLGHTSILLMTESQASYIAQAIEQLVKNDWTAVDVKPIAMHAYYDRLVQRLDDMIWQQTKNSWYQTADGLNVNNWPGRTQEYARLTARVEWEDYKIV